MRRKPHRTPDRRECSRSRSWRARGPCPRGTRPDERIAPVYPAGGAKLNRRGARNGATKAPAVARAGQRNRLTDGRQRPKDREIHRDLGGCDIRQVRKFPSLLRATRDIQQGCCFAVDRANVQRRIRESFPRHVATAVKPYWGTKAKCEMVRRGTPSFRGPHFIFVCYIYDIL